MEAMERLLREMILNGEYNNCPYVYHPGVIKTLNGALQVNLRVWGNDTVEKHMTIKMPYNETFNDTSWDQSLIIHEYSNGAITIRNYDSPRMWNGAPLFELVTDDRENTARFMKRFKQWLDIPKILYNDNDYWTRFNEERSDVIHQIPQFSSLAHDTLLGILELSAIRPPIDGVEGYEEALRSYGLQ